MLPITAGQMVAAHLPFPLAIAMGHDVPLTQDTWSLLTRPSPSPGTSIQQRDITDGEAPKQ